MSTIVKFLVPTFVITYLYNFYVISTGGIPAHGIPSLLIMMWIPGIVSLIYRLVAKLGFSDIGWRLGKFKYHLIAVVLPMALAFVTGLLSHLFSIREISILGLNDWGNFLPIIIGSLVVGSIGALGEEIGWRGFLIPKILNTSIKFPILFTGIIWGLWHLPMVVFAGYYKTDLIYVVGFTYGISMIGLGYFIGWLRLASGSMWVATTAHIAHNFFFQVFFPYAFFPKKGVNVEMWEVIGGDAGLIPALLYLIIVVIGYKVFKFSWGKQ